MFHPLSPTVYTIMSLKNTLYAALILFVTVLACLGVVSIRYVVTLDRITAALPATIDHAIAREADVTRSLLNKHAGLAEEVLDRQLRDLRRDLFARVDSIESRTFTELDQIRVDANRQIADTRTAAVNEIRKISDPAGRVLSQANQLLPPAKNILNVASENADLLGNCDHNPDCIANRAIGTMKAVEKTGVSVQRMAETIQQATPETAAAVKSTSKDLSIIVSRFARPASWIKNAASSAASIIGKFLF